MDTRDCERFSEPSSRYGASSRIKLILTIDVLTNSDHWFLKNIAKTTGFAFLKVTCMKTNY